MTHHPDMPEGVASLLAKTIARRQHRTETRLVFADRRTHGLTTRHTQKLARS